MTRAKILTRWTAALIAISALLFGAAVLAETGREAMEVSAPSGDAPAVETEGGHDEAAEASEQEPAEQAEASAGEASESGEASEHAEALFFGVDLENPVLVWGFVAVSLLVALATLFMGPPALAVGIVLAGVAAVLDGREVLMQFARANPAVAGLTSLTALAHVAVVVLAIMAWLASSRSSPTTGKIN